MCTHSTKRVQPNHKTQRRVRDTRQLVHALHRPAEVALLHVWIERGRDDRAADRGGGVGGVPWCEGEDGGFLGDWGADLAGDHYRYLSNGQVSNGVLVFEK